MSLLTNQLSDQWPDEELISRCFEDHAIVYESMKNAEKCPKLHLKLSAQETIGLKAIGDEKDEELKRNQDREERIAVLRR